MRYFLFIIAFLLASCHQHIRKLDTSNFIDDNFEKIEFVDKKKIQPLRKEWPELYEYLVKGHLFLLKDESEYRYAVSSEFAKFFQKNKSKVFTTPFLQDYDQFKLAFGEVEGYIFHQNSMQRCAFVSIVDKYAVLTSIADLTFCYYFDIKTNKLIR